VSRILKKEDDRKFVAAPPNARLTLRPLPAPDQWLEAHPLYDWFVALWQNMRRSARKIGLFVRKHNIDMSEFQPGPFKSYAEFFGRRFPPGKRRFPMILMRWERSAKADILAGINWPRT
jgi:hypothetical protein